MPHLLEPEPDGGFREYYKDGSEIRKDDVIQTPDGPGKIYAFGFEGPTWSMTGRAVVFLEVPPGNADAYILFLEEAQACAVLERGSKVRS